MRHRNEYICKYAITQNNAVGQVGELSCVAVPAPFNRDWLTRHRLTCRVSIVLHKIDNNALCAGCVGRGAYVIEAAACAIDNVAARAS